MTDFELRVKAYKVFITEMDRLNSGSNFVFEHDFIKELEKIDLSEYKESNYSECMVCLIVLHNAIKEMDKESKEKENKE